MAHTFEAGFVPTEEEAEQIKAKFEAVLMENERIRIKEMAVEEDRQECDKRINDFKTKMAALYEALSMDNFDDGEIKNLFDAMCTASSIISIHHKHTGGGLLDRRLSQLYDHAEKAIEWMVKRKDQRKALQSANMMVGLYNRSLLEKQSALEKMENKPIKETLDTGHIAKIKEDLDKINQHLADEKEKQTLARHYVAQWTARLETVEKFF